MATCQICAREVKAKNGMIAHHGYKRPEEGWQTASCFGARFRSYEVACDALPLAIASCEAYMGHQELLLRGYLKEPPQVITYQRRDAYGKARGAEQKFERPESFDAKGIRRSYRPDCYEYHYDQARDGFKYRIRSAKDDF